MKTILLFECFVIFTFFSSAFSKLDLNFHLEAIDLIPNNTNFKWSDVNELLKTVMDKLLNPNIYGLYTLQKKMHLSSNCFESLHSMIMGLRTGKRWAVEMVDASGKIPSGILEGTVMDFGSFDECLKIKVNSSEKNSKGIELFRGRYCMVGYHSPLLRPYDEKLPEGKSYFDVYGHPPEWAKEVIERAGGYLKRVAFWFGTCVPSTCSKSDIQKISSVFTQSLGVNVSVADCQVDEPYIWPKYTVAAICVMGCLISLCCAGTVVDAICRSRRSNPTNDDDDHILLRVPKAFSLLANTEKLFCFNSGGGCLNCFHGIRFLSATWIVLGHTYFYTDTWKYLKYRHLLGFEEQFNRHLPAAVIENFTIPVGSFFFMSGFLLVYTTWKQLEKSGGKINLFMFFVHKYWRMTPALGLMLIMFLSMPIIDSGPIWNSTLNPPLRSCLNLWWANMLYINNFWNTDQYCLIHTWYLAALMQYHILGVLLLLIAYRWPVVGSLLGTFFMIVCSAAVALLVIWHDFPMPAPGIIKDMDVIEDYTSRIYIKPFTHFTTYMIGMVMAYIILKHHTKKLAPRYRILGWTLAVTGAVSSVYGLYAPAENIAVRVFYIVGHRIVWALSISWMTYACATGVGGIVNKLLSWNAMSSLGQLSYLTYLLHPLVIIYRNASLRERVYYGHTELVFSFLSTLVISLFLAYVGYVTVEAPFASLEKMIFRNRSRMNFKKSEHKEDHSISTRGMKL